MENRVLSPTVREGRFTDAEQLASIFVESWRETYAGILPTDYLVNLSADRVAAQWRLRLNPNRRDQRSWVKVAEDPSFGLLGFGEAGPARDSRLSFGGEIYTLYVHPNWLDSGVGRQLLNTLMQDHSNRGCGSVVIWALQDNPYRHFYTAMGGKVVASRVSSYWGKALEEVAYGWRS